MAVGGTAPWPAGIPGDAAAAAPDEVVTEVSVETAAAEADIDANFVVEGVT